MQTETGWVSYCPECKKETQTTRCACGCGNCTVCGYRWCCYDYIREINKNAEKSNRISS
jgi:hypothetical protein